MNKSAVALIALTAVALTGCSASTTSPATVSHAAAAATKAAPAKPAGPTLTASQKQAVIAAKGYLALGSGFSYQGLIDQLDSSAGNGFSVADSTVAVRSLNADYNAQAKLAAKGYLSSGTGFSHASMITQLDSAAGNKFTPAQAAYGASAVGL